jgi:hypothetical protein
VSTTLQPVERVPVRDRIAKLLETSGRTESGVIVGFTYRALAAKGYDVEEPSAAQVSAVRAAVAELIAAARAIRMAEPWVNSREGSRLPWLVDLPPRRRERRGTYGGTYRYANPGGAVVFRAPTADDIKAWPELSFVSEAVRSPRRGVYGRPGRSDRTNVSHGQRETNVWGWIG